MPFLIEFGPEQLAKAREERWKRSGISPSEKDVLGRSPKDRYFRFSVEFVQLAGRMPKPDECPPEPNKKLPQYLPRWDNHLLGDVPWDVCSCGVVGCKKHSTVPVESLQYKAGRDPDMVLLAQRAVGRQQPAAELKREAAAVWQRLCDAPEDRRCSSQYLDALKKALEE